MYKVIFTHFSILFFIVSILSITKAQSSLDHNTGTFQATVFDNGFYGHGAFGGGGNGIKLTGGSDAMYTSSFLLSSSATKTSGYMHSLTIVTGSEMLNSTHFNGFTSNSDFNQLASAVFNDSGAPAINQTGLIVTQTTFSNTGDNFVIVQFEITNNTGVVKNVIPVELISFYAIVNNNNVDLKWKTATEINNRIFEIERSTNNSDFIKIGYRDGAGSSTAEKEYSFIDQNVFPGNYSYRLKQINFNGTFNYSNEIEVLVAPSLEYSLFQNYPNPFNPTTFIGYSIPQAVHVKLSVYNVLGSEIDILVDEFQEAGSYSKEFSNVQNGLNLTNGVYFYKLEAGNFTATKKFILMK